MIRKTLLLACDPDRAFELLTRQAGAWWPPDRRHTQDPRSQIFIEPGGRFFERATDGREVEFAMEEVFDGWMAGLITKSIPDLQPAFDEFASCLKREAEKA